MNKCASFLCSALALAVACAVSPHATQAQTATGQATIPAARLIAAPGSQSNPSKPKLLEAGATPPDVVAKNLDGREVRLSDFKGQVVVLDFWATWCGPCQRSLPHTQVVAAQVKAQKVVVFAVCTSDTRSNFEKWAKAEQTKFPDIVFACDPRERGAKDFDQRASAQYGVSGIPTQYVIGADGKIVGSAVGFSPEEKALEALLAKAGVKL